MAEENSFVV